MAKGFFTQGVFLLLEHAVSLDQVEAALAPRALVRRGAAAQNVWMGGEALVTRMASHPAGAVLIDVLDAPWPDAMGDPKTAFDLFGAWSLGHLGPFTFPGNLERALQQPTLLERAKERVAGHRALLRLRTSYVLGGGPDTPVFPTPYHPRAELEELTELALALLALPGAVCLFNPGGEVLHSGDSLRQTLDVHRERGLPPLFAWSQVRLLRPGELAPGWLVMDSVGMAQVDVLDHEACFAEEAYDVDEVARFLRNAAAYVLEHGEVIRDGHTMDGPGGRRWRAWSLEASLAPAPRRVLRWLPEDRRDVPEALRPPQLPAPRRGVLGWLRGGAKA